MYKKSLLNYIIFLLLRHLKLFNFLLVLRIPRIFNPGFPPNSLGPGFIPELILTGAPLGDLF